MKVATIPVADTEVLATPSAAVSRQQGRFQAGMPFARVYEDTFVQAAEDLGVDPVTATAIVRGMAGTVTRKRDGLEVEEYTAQTVKESVGVELAYRTGVKVSEASAIARTLIAGKPLTEETIANAVASDATADSVRSAHKAAIAVRKANAKKVTVEQVTDILSRAKAQGIDVSALVASLG
jgi:hypothetical protein